MFQILTLNNISPRGLARLPAERFKVDAKVKEPDAILLRSYNMHSMELPASLLAVGRAGAGVNNIPVPKLSALGIPVFNAPGANANAVKELVIAGMLLAARNICQSWAFARSLSGTDAEISKAVEAGKKDYAGFELPGRTLGVVGLGAIGRLVANAAVALGMEVVGYDPNITVEGAWQLSSSIRRAATVDELIREVEFLTFHVPLNDSTRGMISAERLRGARDGIVLLNFAREGIVDDQAVVDALSAGKVRAYVCDFPTNLLKQHDRVITLPHLGASTGEAEENCAVMVADEVRDFLENGHVRNSVNFPDVSAPRESRYRLAVVNANVPNMLGQISTAMAEAGLNIHDMVNKSRGDLAYTLVDSDSPIPEAAQARIAAIKGVMRARLVPEPR
ncbi:MAG: phosphoglycerate dehydrogenase [Acidiferrobacteraceae bacterium]